MRRSTIRPRRQTIRSRPRVRRIGGKRCRRRVATVPRFRRRRPRLRVEVVDLLSGVLEAVPGADESGPSSRLSAYLTVRSGSSDSSASCPCESGASPSRTLATSFALGGSSRSLSRNSGSESGFSPSRSAVLVLIPRSRHLPLVKVAYKCEETIRIPYMRITSAATEQPEPSPPPDGDTPLQPTPGSVSAPTAHGRQYPVRF